MLLTRLLLMLKITRMPVHNAVSDVEIHIDAVDDVANVDLVG